MKKRAAAEAHDEFMWKLVLGLCGVWSWWTVVKHYSDQI